MVSVVMKIGDTVYLETTDNLGSDYKTNQYRARILDFSNSEIHIDLPINVETSKTGFFYIGTQFKGSLYKDNAVYSFYTTLLTRKKDQVPMLVLSYPGDDELDRSQRRKYVRILISADVAVHAPDHSFKPFTTVSVDLSGGGAAIELPESHSLEEGMGIICWFVFVMQSGEWRYLELPCKVIRLFREKNNGRVKASLMFTDIKEKDRATVIRYCFEKEIEMRHRQKVN